VTSPAPDANPSRKEAAEYIAGLLEGLKLLAIDARLTFLAYLIGIAIQEAQDETSRPD
jgi:hypothetical protein